MIGITQSCFKNLMGKTPLTSLHKTQPNLNKIVTIKDLCNT